MNYIIMADNHMSAFTNCIEASTHKHWMLQLFLSIDKPFNINIKGQNLNCKCIIVDTNIEHYFSSSNELHFTMLIEPTSSIAKSLKSKYIDNGYRVFDTFDLCNIKRKCKSFIKNKNSKSYQAIIDTLFKLLDITIAPKIDYDKRVFEILQLLDKCNCSEHSIQKIADKLFLSPSRMSHLFKEQTGIPLKSYIVLHKLHKAYIFLLNDKKSITETAMVSGFDSPSHLAYTNKLMTGMSLSTTLKNSEFLKVSSFKRV